MSYRECPDCGANLDPGEICDCRKHLSTEDDNQKVDAHPTEEEKQTAGEWEIRVMEELAASDELVLLDLSQDIAIRLIGELADMKAAIRSEREVFPQEIEMLLMRIGRMAVMLDVLQLRYGDAANEEQQFLEAIEQSLEEE